MATETNSEPPATVSEIEVIVYIEDEAFSLTKARLCSSLDKKVEDFIFEDMFNGSGVTRYVWSAKDTKYVTLLTDEEPREVVDTAKTLRDFADATNTITFILKPPTAAHATAGSGAPAGGVGVESEFTRHWSRSVMAEVPLQTLQKWEDFVFAVRYALRIPEEGRVYWIINGETWSDHKHELNSEGSYKLMFSHAVAGEVQIWATDSDVPPTGSPTAASRRVNSVADTPMKTSDTVSVPAKSIATTIADSFDSQALEYEFQTAIMERHLAHGNLQCVFCGHPSVHGEGLEACHIVEVHSKVAVRRAVAAYNVFDTWNGLPCCPLCHDLFDSYLLSIGSDYNIIVSEALQCDSVYGNKYRPLHGIPAKYRFDKVDSWYPPMKFLEYRVRRQREEQVIRENDRRTTDKVYACKKCNKRYKTIGGLSLHMYYKHRPPIVVRGRR